MYFSWVAAYLPIWWRKICMFVWGVYPSLTFAHNLHTLTSLYLHIRPVGFSPHDDASSRHDVRMELHEGHMRPRFAGLDFARDENDTVLDSRLRLAFLASSQLPSSIRLEASCYLLFCSFRWVNRFVGWYLALVIRSSSCISQLSRNIDASSCLTPDDWLRGHACLSCIYTRILFRGAFVAFREVLMQQERNSSFYACSNGVGVLERHICSHKHSFWDALPCVCAC